MRRSLRYLQQCSELINIQSTCCQKKLISFTSFKLQFTSSNLLKTSFIKIKSFCTNHFVESKPLLYIPPVQNVTYFIC